MRPAVLALGVLTLAATLLFLLFPEIDLAVSRAVFLDDRRFLLTGSGLARAINEATPWVVWLTSIAIVAAGIIVAVRDRPLFGLALRHVAFLAASFAVGPGLLVNAVLKTYWGRARPNDIVEFGGTAQFTPALVPADQCVANCSFASGDVAVAFAYVAIALVLPARWRAPALVVALALGTGMAALRLLQGAHFLSDVVFAALSSLLTIAGLAALLLRPRHWAPTRGPLPGAAAGG